MGKMDNQNNMDVPEVGDEMDLELTPLPDKEMPSRPSTELPRVTELTGEIKKLMALRDEKQNKRWATQDTKEGNALQEEVEKLEKNIEALRKERSQLESLPELMPEALKKVEDTPVDLDEESIAPLDEDHRAAA